MSSIESIFESIPVEESPIVNNTVDAPRESFKNMGDKITKGSVEDRIEAFGEMMDDEAPSKPHEQIKVEKDKTPVAPKDKKESIDGAKEKEVKSEEESEEEDSEEESDGDENPASIKEEAPTDPEEQKHKVKVDGKEEEVTLKDLKARYSHRIHAERELSKVQLEKKNFQKEKEQIIGERKFIQKEVADLRESFESHLAEYKKNGFTTKNPLSALDTLLDKIGIDSYAFNRAAFEHNLPEYEKFFEMSDDQREAYFVKKENEFFRKKEQTFAERAKQTQADQARQREEFDLIKRSGLSTDSYNDHFNELEALGADDISVEKVIEFAKVKPIFDKADGIVAKTSRANDIALIQEVSKFLMEFPNTTEEEIIEHIDGTAEERKAAKILKDKENFTVKKKTKKASNSSDSFFTDEEMAEFNQIRRR